MKQRQNNLQRMIRLADDFFGARKDPAQISVDRRQMQRLLKIHPRTMNQRSTKNGPIAWALVLPTTNEVMQAFIRKRITERELLFQTPIHVKYDTVYLSSALVLPEFRRKGYAQRLLVNAVRAIQKQHPITSLCYWGFSTAGRKLARAVANEVHLPLKRRPD